MIFEWRYFRLDAHAVDEVKLVWSRGEAIMVTKEAKRQGKGTLNQALHGECMWSAFPGRF